MNKSPDFEEVTDRSQLDISEPYKVYRIVPEEEQKCECPDEGTGPGAALAGADLNLSGASWVGGMGLAPQLGDVPCVPFWGREVGKELLGWQGARVGFPLA